MSAASKPFDVFLSYKSDDEDWVQRLHHSLQERGVLVWRDQQQIRPGDLFEDALKQGIETSRTLALVMTPRSLQSEWVRWEMERAQQRANEGLIHIIPVVLHDAEIPEDIPGNLSKRRNIDFRHPDAYERNIDHLVWPGLTGQKVCFVTVRSEYGPSWERLEQALRSFGVEYMGDMDVDRATMRIERRAGFSPKTRIVVVTDIFEGKPNEHQGFCRYEPEEYIDFIFKIRDMTNASPDAVVFLLFHFREMWEYINSKANDIRWGLIKRKFFYLERGLPDVITKEKTVENWRKIQRTLLETWRTYS